MAAKNCKIICYMQIESDNELLTVVEAAKELKQLRLIHPENVYEVEIVDEEV